MSRDRSREGAGKSDGSWRKHDLVRRLANGHAHALSLGIGGQGIIIDMHAGDGDGVDKPQQDLFGDNLSSTTAELAVLLGARCGADVVLCEKDKAKRAALAGRGWRNVVILDNHAKAVAEITSRHRWALVLNDPCGPATHGVEHMRAISDRLPVADFVVVSNVGFVARVEGAERRGELTPAKRGLLTSKERHGWIGNPVEWARRLNRRRVSQSPIMNVAPAFRPRVMVIANRLTKASIRLPMREVL